MLNINENYLNKFFIRKLGSNEFNSYLFENIYSANIT